MGKLINRIPGLRLLVSSLLGSALRTHVESLGKPCDVNKHYEKALPGRLDIKGHSPSILFILILWNKSNFCGFHILLKTTIDLTHVTDAISFLCNIQAFAFHITARSWLSNLH